jgi:hypothetical protein
VSGRRDDDKTGDLSAARDQLLARAEEIPTVAYALEVFRAASSQAPLVYPAEPVVSFSTTANG